MHHLRWILVWMVGCFWGLGSLCAQDLPTITASALFKKKLHERFVRLVRGGDGYLYAFQGSLGHYWQFGAEGEYGMQIIRFSPDLKPTDTLRIKRFAPLGQPRNVLEVLPSPQGIALLTVSRDPFSHIPNLQLVLPDFGASPVAFTCEKLMDLPNMNIGVDRPRLRVAYSPDSSSILVGLRRLPSDEATDRSFGFLLFDRDLRLRAGGPYMPFKPFAQDVLVQEILPLDERHILFSVHTVDPGSTLTGPGTISYGFLHFDAKTQELRTIHLANSKEVPVESRMAVSPDGSILAAGWYLDQRQERREAGVYIGRITGADTLENLQRIPLDATMREALIRRERKSGAVGIRTGFHSTLLSHAGGYAFVLHLRGDVDPGLAPAAPGPIANNTLHTWTFGRDFEFYEHTITGFSSRGREEFYETFSWRPLLIAGQWFALASDFSQVHNESRPHEAQTYLWHMPGSDFRSLPIPSDCVFAPRECVQVGEDAWVGIGVWGRRWRLVRVD